MIERGVTLLRENPLVGENGNKFGRISYYILRIYCGFCVEEGILCAGVRFDERDKVIYDANLRFNKY